MRNDSELQSESKLQEVPPANLEAREFPYFCLKRLKRVGSSAELIPDPTVSPTLRIGFCEMPRFAVGRERSFWRQLADRQCLHLTHFCQ